MKTRFIAQSVEPDGRKKRAPNVRPVFSNQGIRAKYHAVLVHHISRMRQDVLKRVLAAYEQFDAQQAQDETPLERLKRTFSNILGQWQEHFDKHAESLASQFVQQASGHATRSVRNSLRDLGFTVQFQATPAVKEAVNRALTENIGLIKSIPTECLDEVQELVEKSALAGRDLGTLTDEIKRRFDVADSRAALIARDQNNKVSASITRRRQQDLGISEGIWLHSGASRHPRPEHVAANGKRFNLEKGLYLDGHWTMPGEDINCGCTWRPILPGFNDG